MKLSEDLGGFCEHQVRRHQWKQFWRRGGLENSIGEAEGERAVDW